ncbi:V-type ATP synthase subunit F [Erysipelothrix anatis]|uniref:V-type ATP synthase subunit F n=1 Tax=Erysipelothrix anatis TaxID=2683713 RepID=UPI0013578F41|nr:V-type ATP synthase subunit F [Erysipelothrix anatis]
MMHNILYLSYDDGHALLESMGIAVYRVKRHESIAPLLRELKQNQKELILVDETIYRDHKETINNYNTDPLLTIVMLSDGVGSYKEAQKRLHESIEQAIGTLKV